MFYSAKTGGFYLPEIHGTAIPDDAVEIDAEEWRALLQGQRSGQEIVAGENGKPTLRPREQGAPAIPAVVTMRQARLALLAAGHLDAVEHAFDSMPADVRRAAQIEWEYAGHVERASAFTQQMAAMLNLDEAALDALFLAASQL